MDSERSQEQMLYNHIVSYVKYGCDSQHKNALEKLIQGCSGVNFLFSLLAIVPKTPQNNKIKSEHLKHADINLE